jgi:hypothetical protein
MENMKGSISQEGLETSVRSKRLLICVSPAGMSVSRVTESVKLALGVVLGNRQSSQLYGVLRIVFVLVYGVGISI